MFRGMHPVCIYQTLLGGGGGHEVYERTKNNLKDVCFNEFVCTFVNMAAYWSGQNILYQLTWPQVSGKFYGYVKMKNVAIFFNVQNIMEQPKIKDCDCGTQKNVK